MRIPKSIRWRLQLWYGALLVAVLSGFGFTAFHFARARQLRRIDEGLQKRVSVLVDALRVARPAWRTDVRPRPIFTPTQAELFDDEAGHYFVIWMQGPEPILSSLVAPAGVPKPGSGDALPRMRGDFRETFLFAAPVNCVLVGRRISAEQADLRTLAALLVTVGSAVLAAGFFGGWWFVTRALRPIAEISATAEKIAAGDLSQRIGTAETDSELGQLAAVLNSTFTRLETAFAQQARFTSDAAHELRTPVAVMLTQTQSALARERTATDYRETLESCQRATQRMRRLIESLLELARFDAGQEPLRRVACDLAKIAAECIELIRPLVTARGLTMHTALSPAPSYGDAERLAQVVTNLLANAVAYNRTDGEIRVTTELRGGIATLTVANTGPGISAENLPHIFERFHRADLARTGSAGHSGLGLAIAEAIVHAHGGTIAVVSEEEKGATFTVRLG
ncbi:MAG: HAMP domain-containing protein [Chthoniobacter sp.]|nr:HAMP domain-containing protein [Chthoniobacter sp.]